MANDKPAELNLQRHSKERVYNGFFKIDKSVISFTEPGGRRLENVTLEVFERGDSAAAILHDAWKDEVILTEQFRYPTYEKGPGRIIEAIAGSIEPGEDPAECIRREIREEVGYEVKDLKPIGKFYVSPGGTSERIFLFYCKVSRADLKDESASGVAHQNEAVTRLYWPTEKLFEALDAGELDDAKLIIGAHWLRRHLGR